MTGAEAARLRKRLGYTQAQLAQLLGISTPTVSRSEVAERVPAEHSAVLRQLPPAPREEGGRSAYRQQRPPPLPRKAPGQQTPRARQALPREGEASAPRAAPPSAPALPERVWEVEEIGAHLLEVPEPDSSLASYWVRVVACRELVQWRARSRGWPCR
jgi:hypothetical protein